MMKSNTQLKWLEKYKQLMIEASSLRDSQSVAFGLLDAYDDLSAPAKLEIHEVLSEWLVSEDNKLRYDAGFLTSQRGIVEMLPAIENAIKQIGVTTSPESEYERKKLMRIYRDLQAILSNDK
jgi:hypothetical protein